MKQVANGRDAHFLHLNLKNRLGLADKPHSSATQNADLIQIFTSRDSKDTEMTLGLSNNNKIIQQSKQKKQVKTNKRQNFLDIMRESNTQQEEQNNDSTNAISTNGTTTPILTPTNFYGSGNGGNYQYNMGEQGQSQNVSENGGNDTTTHNGGFAGLLKEKDDRIKNLIARSKEESRRSRSGGEGSQGIGRSNKQKNLTREERDNLDRLEKAQKFIITQII